MRAAVALLLITACGPAPRPAQRAFYYWRTAWPPSSVEQAALAQHRVGRLFVRFFDVAWDEAAQAARPVGKLVVAAGAPAGVEVIPVVYVRNDVWRRARADAARALAGHVAAELISMSSALGFIPREVQLDCDWTDSTREAYFAFLRELRAALGVPLSSTIRLHQVKYRERTGVPPVERGMLMFYNMGALGPGADDHYIFDAKAASRYLARISDYPLPLDVALPLWSWTVQVRGGAVAGLLQNVATPELSAQTWLRRAPDATFEATRTTFLHGTLVRAGDRLKPETTDSATTLAAARLVAKHLAPSAAARTVALFDLSPSTVERHDSPSLEAIFSAVR